MVHQVAVPQENAPQGAHGAASHRPGQGLGPGIGRGTLTVPTIHDAPLIYREGSTTSIMQISAYAT